MYKIYMIEDDPNIISAVAAHGQRWELAVTGCRDFKDIIGEIAREQPHLIIMDVGLPYFDGFYWCGRIREVSGVPILFLSAMSDNLNQVMAMNMGGDDFITKPFDAEVLIAKIRALLRRAYDLSDTLPITECRGAVLKADSNALLYGGAEIPLTRNEQRILSVLMENKGRAVSREKLMDALWETDSFIDDNTLTVNVGRLRKKLADHGLTDFIETRVGTGYIVRAS